MNAATAYEQSRMLELFLQAHPAPLAVIVAIDQEWCSAAVERFTSRSFPEWMYRRDLWPAYREMLTPYAVQEAANQFAVMMGWKKRRYGRDGYTSFVPPDSEYDIALRDAKFQHWAPVDNSPAPVGAEPDFPALPTLSAMLRSLPEPTRKIVFFSPLQVTLQGKPGSAAAWRWTGCKREVGRIARETGALALDFNVPTSITDNRDNYWDPVHYRHAIAARLMNGLIAGASPDARILAAAP